MIAWFDQDFSAVSPRPARRSNIILMEKCRTARPEEEEVINAFCHTLTKATLDAFRDITRKFWRSLFRKYPDTYAEQWSMIQNGDIRLGAFSFDIDFPKPDQAWVLMSSQDCRTVYLITPTRHPNMKPMMELLMTQDTGVAYVIHSTPAKENVPARVHVVLAVRGEAPEDQLARLAQTFAQINSNEG